MATLCRIAVVDDREEVTVGLTRMLGVGGHEARAFSSAAEFLKAYEPAAIPAPEIAILDIKMPDMDGTELCRRAIEMPKFDRTIFIALTGHLLPTDASWLKPIGFDFVLRKPPEPEELFAIIASKDELINRLKPKRWPDFPAAIAALSELRQRNIELEEKYVKMLIAPEVFSLLESSPQELDPRDRAVAIGFADVRGFTQLSNRVQSHQVAKILGLFFTHAAWLVRQGGGLLDKFVGDSVMWFHQGESTAACSTACLKTAATIMSNMDRLNEVIARHLHVNLRIGIGMGVACGHAAVGIFGAPGLRIQYGVLGPPVNLAARLCAEAPAGTLLVGGEAIEHCTYKTSPIGFRAVKGFDHEIEVHKVQVPDLDAGPDWANVLDSTRSR